MRLKSDNETFFEQSYDQKYPVVFMQILPLCTCKFLSPLILKFLNFFLQWLLLRFILLIWYNKILDPIFRSREKNCEKSIFLNYFKLILIFLNDNTKKFTSPLDSQWSKTPWYKFSEFYSIYLKSCEISQ